MSVRPGIMALMLALIAGAAVSIASVAQGADIAPIRPEELHFFEKEVRPLLVKHCYQCHSAEAKILKGGLLLDSRGGWMKGGDSGPAIVPGVPDESLIIEAVRYESLEMPPK